MHFLNGCAARHTCAKALQSITAQVRGLRHCKRQFALNGVPRVRCIAFLCSLDFCVKLLVLSLQAAVAVTVLFAECRDPLGSPLPIAARIASSNEFDAPRVDDDVLPHTTLDEVMKAKQQPVRGGETRLKFGLSSNTTASVTMAMKLGVSDGELSRVRSRLRFQTSVRDGVAAGDNNSENASIGTGEGGDLEPELPLSADIVAQLEVTGSDDNGSTGRVMSMCASETELHRPSSATEVESFDGSTAVHELMDAPYDAEDHDAPSRTFMPIPGASRPSDRDMRRHSAEDKPGKLPPVPSRGKHSANKRQSTGSTGMGLSKHSWITDVAAAGASHACIVALRSTRQPSSASGHELDSSLGSDPSRSTARMKAVAIHKALV